jgi:hypothetical protein
VYEDDLRKLVVRAVHGRLPTRKTEKKKDAVRFWRTMKNLQDNGIVDGAHYGLAPGREKTYMLSKRAKAYMARSAAKTRPQYAAVLGL